MVPLAEKDRAGAALDAAELVGALRVDLGDELDAANCRSVASTSASWVMDVSRRQKPQLKR